MRSDDETIIKTGSHKYTYSLLSRTSVNFVIRHRIIVFIVTALITAASIFGMHKLVVETDLHRLLGKSSAFSVATDFVASRFRGATSFNVIIEGNKEGMFEDPALLRSLDLLQKFIDQLPNVGKTISAADYLKVINRALHDNDPNYYVLPKSKQEIAQYLSIYSLADPDKTLNQYLDDKHKSAKVLLRTGLGNSSAILNLKKQIEKECTKLFSPQMSCGFTSDAYLVAATVNSIARGILISFTTAGVAITIVMYFLFRSLKIAVISMIPNVLPIIYILGLMGFCGIEFNIATSLVMCIAIGIAVDDTITYLARYFYELKQTNHYLLRATTGIKITEAQIQTIHNTNAHVGRPIIVTAVAVFFGFIILVFSQFVPIMWYGVLTAVTMLIAAICELIILPALLASIRI